MDLNSYKVVSFTPSTFGRTNIETADTISAIASAVGASCVLAIDSLACTSLDRLGSNIQLSDSGLRIGSNRKVVNESTIGVPVISIGVPTIIQTKYFGVNTPCDDFMTVTNIESVVKNAALIVACAVTQIAYPTLDYSFSKMIVSEIAQT